MKISFNGMDAPIEIHERGMTILRVLNESLFARICESIVSMKGEEAKESYSIWDDDGREANAPSALFVIVNPFDLPWKHRGMTDRLYAILEEEMRFDEDLRHDMQEAHQSLESLVHRLGYQLNCDYGFGVEWSLEKYLKAFSYEANVADANSLLDNIISFVDFGADIGIDKVFVFVNLKTFLTKQELSKLNDRLFFHGMRALLLENLVFAHDERFEQEYVIDQDFVEHVFKEESERPSSSQGGFCPNGFGAVTF